MQHSTSDITWLIFTEEAGYLLYKDAMVLLNNTHKPLYKE